MSHRIHHSKTLLNSLKAEYYIQPLQSQPDIITKLGADITFQQFKSIVNHHGWNKPDDKSLITCDNCKKPYKGRYDLFQHHQTHRVAVQKGTYINVKHAKKFCTNHINSNKRRCANRKIATKECVFSEITKDNNNILFPRFADHENTPEYYFIKQIQTDEIKADISSNDISLHTYNKTINKFMLIPYKFDRVVEIS
eukprot:482747_1